MTVSTDYLAILFIIHFFLFMHTFMGVIMWLMLYVINFNLSQICTARYTSLSQQEVDPLSPIIYIGCAICIVCSLLAIVAFGVFK